MALSLLVDGRLSCLWKPQAYILSPPPYDTQKAKQKAVSLEKDLRELMEYLDIPTGTIMADSQGAGSFGESKDGRVGS